MMEPLHERYRPQSFDEVIGQPGIVKALQRVIAERGSHSFLFSGPAGTGKTTLARICAAELGCPVVSIREVDAAKNTGVDDMRSVVQLMQYRPLHASTAVVVVDECHRLSGNAWDSMLKATEEPPAWGFWFFCTTNPTKVPKTIVSRCATFAFKSVSKDDLFDYLKQIVDLEGVKVDDQIIDLCAKEAEGGVRQALSNLTVCLDASDRAEAADLLRSAAESPEAVELARLLLKGTTWEACAALLQGLKDENPESIRQVVRAYMTSVVMGAKTDKAAAAGLNILAHFSDPFPSGDGISPVLLACGRVVFS